ncbi:MAG: hypothetical protein JWR26_4190 [Pedosphaera sp.]|nr:hypothetical protein [Pedosphaera sp.]
MLKKVLLTCSLTAFAIGFSDVGEAPQWGLGRPLGAVFFILFLIVMLLEKETALYDEEERLKSSVSKPVPTAEPEAHGAWQTS